MDDQRCTDAADAAASFSQFADATLSVAADADSRTLTSPSKVVNCT